MVVINLEPNQILLLWAIGLGVFTSWVMVVGSIKFFLKSVYGLFSRKKKDNQDHQEKPVDKVSPIPKISLDDTIQPDYDYNEFVRRSKHVPEEVHSVQDK